MASTAAELRETASLLNILVIGASYGGLAATVNLLDFCHGMPSRFKYRETRDPLALPITAVEVDSPPTTSVQITLVDERDGYYHLLGSPLALAEEHASKKFWTKFEDIPALNTPSVRCLNGRVTSVDCAEKVAAIQDIKANGTLKLKYDYLVAASGLRRVWPVVPQSLSEEEYLFETKNHIEAVANAREGVVVIGGGAVGLEMAAELKLVYPQQRVTLIHSRNKLLSAEPLPDDFKDRCLSALQDMGVDVILDRRVMGTKEIKSENGHRLYELSLSDNTTMLAGHTINAISKQTSTASFLPEAALNEKGHVKITPSLQFAADIPNANAHFAIGDIASWSGIKRCGMAMHMGQYAAHNIYQQILSKANGDDASVLELQPMPPMIVVAVGKKAVGHDPVNGTTAGKELMQRMFEDDLAWGYCWRHLGLGHRYRI